MKNYELSVNKLILFEFDQWFTTLYQLILINSYYFKSCVGKIVDSYNIKYEYD